MTGVEVPEWATELGFSGLFTTECAMTGTPEQIQRQADRAPMLLPGNGWLLLSVDVATRTGTLVRQDMGAVADLCIRRPSEVTR